MMYACSEDQTKSSSTYLYSTLLHLKIINVFFNVLKVTSCATGKLNVSCQMGYSIELLYTDTFMGIELNKLTIDVATTCFTPCQVSSVSLFKNSNSLQKGKSIW